jgi:hypothetical protein
MSDLKSVPGEARDRERGLLLSDRLNPLLVRDLQQSFAGRGFVAALSLALIGMLVVASIALDFTGEARGPRALSVVLFALGVMVSIVVPLQAFQSTRQEMQGGTADQLLLSSLSPATIVRGKLLAAAVKLLLWISLFSPLIALTWLLRGISVSQIALAIFTAGLAGLAMCGLAVVLGTLTVFRRVGSLVHVASALVLGGGGLGVASALAGTSYAWLSFGAGGDMLAVLLVVVVLAVISLALCILMAQSQFTHPHENRSTGFRLFLPVVSIVGWLLVAATASRTNLNDALPVISLVALAFGSVFFIFAATEERPLSPRVQAQVPAGPGRAMGVALLLPGGGRGLLWSVVTAALLVLGPELLASALSVHLDDGLSRAVSLAGLYTVLYAAIGSVVRGRLPQGPSGSWWARLIVLGVLVLGTVLSTLVLILQSRVSDWGLMQIFNPFWTIGAYAQDNGDAAAAMPLLVAMVVVMLLLNAGVMAEALSEVGKLSAARRQRAA